MNEALKGGATMEVALKGVVVPFPASRSSSSRKRRLRAVAGLPETPVHDERVNADWDLLIRVASHAWSWRDPDSLATLEQTVTRLRDWIDRDWST